MKTERELFEETLSRIGKTDESTFDKHDDGSYKMDIIHFGWKIWQASANREGYKLVPVIDKNICDHYYIKYEPRCIKCGYVYNSEIGATP